ncbi:MAG: SUMF1/EgtB/PvdO family nonheme iron enzyme [Gammaproteobacteria bacterium]|nr:SUMF1/EgtB/PvdO family nonheme iron enzyme [Gammaproteobacteria bacterium]
MPSPGGGNSYAATRLHPASVISNLIDRDGGRTADANRVLRGGSWNNHARNVRAAYRNHNRPDNRNDNLGFRCARTRERIGRSEPEQTSIPGVPGGSPKRKGHRRVSSGSGCLANARRRVPCILSIAHHERPHP